MVRSNSSRNGISNSTTTSSSSRNNSNSKSVLLQINDDDNDSSSNSNSNINQKKSINIAKLEHEIIQDISNDTKYYAEDEMKKRAVQTSRDYDEFRNFVACSQLKPVQSGDMGQLFVGRRSESYNYHNSNNNNGGSGSYASATVVQNKRCSVQMNNEKRLAALLNDIDATLAGGENTTICTSSNECDNRYNAKEDEDFLESLSISATAKTVSSHDTAYDYVLNLKTKTKKIVEREMTSSGRKKNKKRVKGATLSSSNNPQLKKNHGKSRNCSGMKSNLNNEPQNAMEFEKEWKLFCQDSTFDDILQYLTLSSEESDDIFEKLGKKSPIPPSAPSSSSYQTTTKVNKATHSSKNPPQESKIAGSSFPLLRIPTDLRLKPEQVSQSIYQVEINSNIMGQIIQTLHYLLSNYYSRQIIPRRGCNNEVVDDCNSNFSGCYESCDRNILHFIYRWMDALTKCGRFDLNIEFLNEEQKQCIHLIFDVLEREIRIHTERFGETKHLHQQDVDDILKLKSLFVST